MADLDGRRPLRGWATAFCVNSAHTELSKDRLAGVRVVPAALRCRPPRRLLRHDSRYQRLPIKTVARPFFRQPGRHARCPGRVCLGWLRTRWGRRAIRTGTIESGQIACGNAFFAKPAIRLTASRCVDNLRRLIRNILYSRVGVAPYHGAYLRHGRRRALRRVAASVG